MGYYIGNSSKNSDYRSGSPSSSSTTSSSSKSSTTSTTSKPSSSGSSSSGSKSSGGGSSSSTQRVNTAGLSGYALDYANSLNAALNVGSSLTAAQNAATAAANQASYGNTSGPSESQGRDMLNSLGIYSSIVPTVEQPKPDILSQIMQQINQPPQLIPMPEYKQPDYSSLIPQPQQGVAATANPADTYFLPTARYNDRVAQMRQSADSLAQQAYATNLGSWNQQNQLAQSARNSQLSTLASLIPSVTISPYQQAQLDAQKSGAELERTIQDQKSKQWEAEYGLKQQQLAQDQQKVDYEIGKPYYNPNSGGGGSGGSSGSSSGGLSKASYGSDGGIKPSTALVLGKEAFTKMKQSGYGKQSLIDYLNSNMASQISRSDDVAYRNAINELMSYADELYPSNVSYGD